MIKRLRKQFIRIAMLAVTSVLVLLCVTVNVGMYVSTDSQLNRTLSMISENEGKMPEKPPEKEMRRGGLPDKPFNEETPFATRYFVLRYTDSGELINSNLERIAAVKKDDVDSFLKIATKKGEGTGYASGYKYLIRTDKNGENIAIFLDCYKETQSMYRVLLFSVLATAVCILLVFLIVRFLSKKAMAPVEKASEQQKQFITDAGHELKTPITVIATSLKVLEMENGQQKWIDKAKAQTEKLTELVNALVTLSRMEETEPLHMAHFAISDTVRETAESFRDFSDEKGHPLTVEVEPDLSFCGDEYYVRRLVSILMDNAIKYATADTPILLCMKKTKKGVSVFTENDCENIEPDDIHKLFDRFFRADKSRNAATGGFGIGLSIVRSIAEAHGGNTRAEMTENGRLRLTAELIGK